MGLLRRPDRGALDQRITIQQSTTSVNSLGERVPTWSTFATVWAQAQPLRGRELMAAGQMQSPADVRFRIDYRTGVTDMMRVMWNSKPYDIVGQPINVDGGNHTLELMCTSGVRDGR